ncbi:hypothetical protein AB0M46_32160 [Dactylosporangium sp. NPDC051485]|uniref:hypothetical protein n=1 Tax=Dactylosporangium sp. NPDC051485 TaxID=3154846 RepID=UPI00342BFADD
MPVLLIARLTVRGSYVRDVELPSDATFDTVQFFVPDDGPVVYRVRTFAVDHDIHVHGLGRQPVEALRAHLDRTVGDVLAGVDEVTLPTMRRPDLLAAGIDEGDLEVAPQARFAFWNPDGGQYATRAAPIAPGERDGLREVVYLGGIARFWLPETWEVEQDPQSGGCFYDPDGEGTLRLSVLTFDTSAATGPPALRQPRKPGERQIDGGTLPTGCEFDVYEVSAVEDGEDLRIRYWQIGQELAGQCRIHVFSYTYPAAAGAQLAGELALLDRELRRMIPYPDPV